MSRSLALLGAAALGAALFLAGYAAALLDGRTVPNKDWDEADDMCPNCVTPWKCNGPHISRPERLRWSDTGEAVETYQTFTMPAVTSRTLRSVGA